MLKVRVGREALWAKGSQTWLHTRVTMGTYKI